MNNFIDQQNESFNTKDCSNANEADGKKVFVAYFDILGFKNYVMNHDLNELVKMMDDFVRDSQSSTTDRNKFSSHSCESDMSTSKVKVLHVSDSLIYWTQGNSIEDFENILDASRKLFMITNTTRVPLRGCITYGDLYFTPYTISENTNKFYQFSMFGKSIVHAYTKAENIKIVGCVIDDFAIRRVNEINGSDGINAFIKAGKVVYRSIPQKGENGVCVKPECIIKPFCADSSITELEFYNRSMDLEGAFKEMSNCNKGTSIEVLPEDVKQKLNNTIDFYRSFLNPDKSCSK